MKKLILMALLLLTPVFTLASIDTNLYYGLQNNSDVRELQEFLIDKGFLDYEPTGNFFSLTLNAVKAYQKKQGIIQTGYVGTLTRTAINNELSTQLSGSNAEATTETGTTPPAPVPQATNNDVISTLQAQIALLMQQLSAMQAQQTTTQQIQQNTQQITQNTQQITQNNSSALANSEPEDAVLFQPELSETQIFYKDVISLSTDKPCSTFLKAGTFSDGTQYSASIDCHYYKNELVEKYIIMTFDKTNFYPLSVLVKHNVVPSKISKTHLKLISACENSAKSWNQETQSFIDVGPDNVYYKIFLGENLPIPIKQTIKFQSSYAHFCEMDNASQKEFADKIDALSAKYDGREIGYGMAFLIFGWQPYETFTIPNQ